MLRTPSFFGSIDTRWLSDMQFSNVISEDQHVVRSAAQIAKATKDFFLISLQIVGNGSVCQDSRNAHLKPGQLALYDTTRSYELLFAKPFEQIVLQMPREQLKPFLALPEASVAQVVDGRRGLGKVTLDLIVSTWQEIDNLAPQQLDCIKGIIVELLAAALNEAVCNKKTSSRSQLGRLLEIKGFINSRLRNPQLGVEMIADAFQLSTRYVP